MENKNDNNFLKDSIIEHMNRALFLESEAEKLEDISRSYEASIALSDAEDAWNDMKDAMNKIHLLNPENIS